MIRVRFYGRLSDVLGVKEIELDEKEIRKLSDLSDLLYKKFGEKAKNVFLDKTRLRPGVTVLINGEAAVFKGGASAELKQGDDVIFDTIDIYEVEGGG